MCLIRFYENSKKHIIEFMLLGRVWYIWRYEKKLSYSIKEKLTGIVKWRKSLTD